MFWVKTEKGGLCNLAVATRVEILPHGGGVHRKQVVAYFPTDPKAVELKYSFYATLFVGSADSCKAYVGELAGKLRAWERPY